VRFDQLTHEVIGLAIEVHRVLGPGKDEPAYERAVSHELCLRGVPHVTQRPIPIVYKGIRLDCGYRLDVLVSGLVVAELKAVHELAPIHTAQLLTQLKLGGWGVGLLLNFHVATLKDGIRRVVAGYEDHDGAAPDPCSDPNLIADHPACVSLSMGTQTVGNPALDEIERAVIEAGVEVHRHLGPGLLASAYRACLRGAPLSTALYSGSGSGMGRLFQ
jgi:GxxExxY protein